MTGSSTRWSRRLAHGMVKELRRTFEKHDPPFRVIQADLQSLPFEDRSFDIVMAHHMLYHVPNLDLALSEVHRVLRDGGRFFAATNGEAHLAELAMFLEVLYGPEVPTRNVFALETGEAVLRSAFAQVESMRAPGDVLEITDAEAVIDYCVSLSSGRSIDPAKLEELSELIRSELSREGVIRATCDSGFFVARS
jgi:SAM-dependent methyltransferase